MTSIRNKLFNISTIAPTLLIFLLFITSASVIITERQHIENQTILKAESRLKEKSGIAQSVIEYGDRYNIDDLIKNTLNNLTVHDYIRDAFLISEDNVILSANQYELIHKNLKDSIDSMSLSTQYSKLILTNTEAVKKNREAHFIIAPDKTSAAYVAFVQLKNKEIGILLITYDLARNIATEQSLALRWHIIYITIFALIYLLLALVFHKTITNRTLELLKAINRYAAGERTIKLNVAGNDEIGQLADGIRDLFQQTHFSEELLISKSQELININNELKYSKQLAEKSNKAKTEFLANMSHEIRTPMSVILGSTDMLLESKLDDETRKRYLKILRKSCESLMSLINDILDVSRIEAGAVRLVDEHFDIASVLLDAIEANAISAQQKQLELNYSISENLAVEYIGDASRIKQVLNNLINNAIKYTNKGSVFISIQEDPERPQPGCLLITVKDTGVGIPESFQDKIFKNFSQGDISTTKKYGGVGLGLVISKHLAEKMNGQIRYKSTPGEGSEFFFTLELKPYTPATSNERRVLAKTESKSRTEPESNTYSLQDNSNKFKILIVEDTEDVRALLKALLQSPDLEIAECENGKCAVEKIKNNNFDLIFMDIQMPVMDGFDALKLIRQWELSEHLDHHQVVALTAYAMKEDREKCLNAGFDFYMSKPVKRQEIRDFVAKLKATKHTPSSLNH